MSLSTLDHKTIELLRDIPDLMPVSRTYYEDWSIRVFNREQNNCKNYLSPNRREFYKILFITEGTGIFTLGKHTYYIDEPTILFIHPAEIISWRNLSEQSGGHYTLFKRSFIDAHSSLKAVIEKYHLFSDVRKSIIKVDHHYIAPLKAFFMQMHAEELIGGVLAEDAMQAYLQLIMVQSARIAAYPAPDLVSDEYKHVHKFFQLLEKETAGINYSNPIRIRTAKEFAESLSMHPNHLNVLLKKHTGQNVSTHIKNRLLEESKALLIQTNWTLQDIGYSIGFSDQPNFSLFFKKNTGITPADFRKSYRL